MESYSIKIVKKFDLNIHSCQLPRKLCLNSRPISVSKGEFYFFDTCHSLGHRRRGREILLQAKICLKVFIFFENHYRKMTCYHRLTSGWSEGGSWQLLWRQLPAAGADPRLTSPGPQRGALFNYAL